MSKLIECVPNFSEGRKPDVIEAIAKSIKDSDGCHLLDVDVGESTNRTVYTFVGNPSSVIKGALNAAKVAFKLIDMSTHKGEHPRFGAMDVCPFIAVRDTTIDDCIECANQFANLLATTLDVPVYLYGAAARSDERKLLPNIRSGEYKNLPKKLKDPLWLPDYGTSEFVSSWGATAVGARNFLIAYNINLISTKEQAHKIALNVREKGRGPTQRGRLKNVQAIGWYLDEHNLAQVSANLTDLGVTKIYQLYEEVCKDAKELNLPVVGSQIVGLVPLKAVLEVAQFYIDQEKLFVLDEMSKVKLAISRLGLDSLGKFEPSKKIIEYAVADENRDFPLGTLSVQSFVKSVASRTPTPGGGSVSALVASLGAALCTMAGQLSYGKKQWESVEETMRKSIPSVHESMMDLIPLIDLDATAFNTYMDALKMPKETDDQKAKRNEKMLQGILQAIEVPMQVMSKSNQAWSSAKEIAQSGNKACLSDLQVGARCLEIGVWGALQNVVINLPKITDESLKNKIEAECMAKMKTAEDACKEILEILLNRKA
uniref:Formimidoyltransferase-cyclodeaminase n=1 Tax=Phallusia mammillata TaxID=59560 RepID=A0A6F9DCL4_9ASCI|nr:formimidoyltransferase-cyclodeaminase-like [Phallusia mammillata]